MSFRISADGDVVYRYAAYTMAERVPPDDERFRGNTLLHETCRGFVDHMQTTETAAVLHCRKCGLRVVVPAALETFGDFRDWLATNPPR